jgi:hypothetical protein
VAHPACNGYRVSFLAVKLPGRGVYHPSSSNVEVKERVRYLYCISGPIMACYRVTFTSVFIGRLEEERKSLKEIGAEGYTFRRTRKKGSNLNYWFSSSRG